MHLYIQSLHHFIFGRMRFIISMTLDTSTRYINIVQNQKSFKVDVIVILPRHLITLIEWVVSINIWMHCNKIHQALMKLWAISSLLHKQRILNLYTIVGDIGNTTIQQIKLHLLTAYLLNAHVSFTTSDRLFPSFSLILNLHTQLWFWTLIQQ